MMRKKLSTKQVADKLGYSVMHFRSAIKHGPDFPKAKQLPLANGGYGHPFWFEDEIDDYLAKLEKHAA